MYLPTTPSKENLIHLLRTDVQEFNRISRGLFTRRGVGVDLGYANLSGFDLSFAYLGGAILYGAVMSDANLFHTDMSFAKLDGANFERARFLNTNLRSARLSKVNTDGAKGIIRIVGIDERRHNLFRITWDSWYMYCAGCRWFRFEDAIRHWGNPEYPDKERGKRYVDVIHAMNQWPAH